MNRVSLITRRKKKNSFRQKWWLGMCVIVCCATAWRAVMQDGGEPVSSNRASQVEPKEQSRHADILSQLLMLTKAVDNLQGEERRKKASELEATLKSMEATLQQAPEDSATKQQVNLITLVRTALQKDEAGEEMDVSDAALQEYGITPYASPQYWENAYQKKKFGELFDWYLGVASETEQNKTLGALLMDQIKPHHNILHAGCGNSNTTMFLYENGRQSITNVDVSASIIEQMRGLYAAKYRSMQWTHMDATQMEFEDATFDVVFEKGLSDVFISRTGNHSQSFLAEAKRVLKPDGRLISVAFWDTDKHLADLKCEHYYLGSSMPSSNEKSENLITRKFHLSVCRL